MEIFFLITIGIIINVVLTLRLEKHMAADKAALDAKIDEVGTRLGNVIADLQAKIDAGAQPADFQPEVDKLQAVVDALNAADPDQTNNTPTA